MRIETRIADASDVDALARLNGQAQRLHATLYPKDFKTQVNEAELRSFLRAALARDGTRWLVAEIEGSAVGYAWLEVQIRPETPFRFAKRRLFLHQLCVDGDHRRHGVASALMDHAARLARENAVEEIALDTWSANGTAQSFFRARGFEPYMALMRKPSGEAPGGA